MDPETRRTLQRWKRFTAIGLLTSGLLLTALGAVSILWLRTPAKLTDERLLGVWQSDVDRTIAELKKSKPMDARDEQRFRALFGKLRVTYNKDTCSTELDGDCQTFPYEVVGYDKYAVVIRAIDPNAKDRKDALQSTEYRLVHFDGSDSYWIESENSTIREYFKRVP